MTEQLLFPGLGLAFDLSRVAFSIGNFVVYWYGILFALGFVAGMAYFYLRAKSVGIHPYDGLDVLLWAVIGGVIGARAYYVIFQWEMYQDNLMRIFAFREGGMAIYGGVLGALAAGYIACRKKKLPPGPLLDVGFPGLLLAQAIGRWGNFFNIEAFGSNTILPWGMTSRTIVNYLFDNMARLEAMDILVDPTMPVHPTFLYESLWNLAGFLLLAFVLTPRRKYDGQVFLGYMAWYGFGRFFIEQLRTDSLMAGEVRASEALALILFVTSAALLVYCWLQEKKETRPAWLGLYVNTDESRERYSLAEKELEDERLAAQEKRAKRRGEATTGEETSDAQPEETQPPKRKTAKKASQPDETPDAKPEEAASPKRKAAKKASPPDEPADPKPEEAAPPKRRRAKKDAPPEE